jgi:D-alanine-D-alanine ligase-like ATP-grasp enzyme
MIKTFCINGQSYEFIRPSIPDIDKISSEKISKNGECTLTNELIYQSKKNKIFGEQNKRDNIDKVLEEKFKIVKNITLLFLEKTKITLFGLDFLYDIINDAFYILEINYFPSYRELGNKINSEFDQHVIKFYNEYKIE